MTVLEAPRYAGRLWLWAHSIPMQAVFSGIMIAVVIGIGSLFNFFKEFHEENPRGMVLL